MMKSGEERKSKRITRKVIQSSKERKSRLHTQVKLANNQEGLLKACQGETVVQIIERHGHASNY